MPDPIPLQSPFSQDFFNFTDQQPSSSPPSNITEQTFDASAVDLAAAIFPSSPPHSSEPSPFSFLPMNFEVATNPETPHTPHSHEDLSKSPTMPTKRGYKSHVPSACINCKKAHLACDVSRPCKRCVSLNKTDTCQDIKHKKRGRPKLRDSKSSQSQGPNGKYEVMYGTIHMPSFSATSATYSTSSMYEHEPATPIPGHTSAISFIHEPLESFQTPKKIRPAIAISSSQSQSIQPQLQPQPEPQSQPQIQIQLQPHSQLHSQSEQPSQSSQPAPILPILAPAPFAAFSPFLPIEVQPSFTNTFAEPLIKEENQTVTVFMSMEVCCARISDEVTEAWGYYPQELAHRSLYDFVPSKDSDRLACLHRLVLDNAVDVAKQSDPNYQPTQPTERTTSDLFHRTDPILLATPAIGSSRFSDTIHIKKRSGDNELYEVIVFLGGGFGANLHSIGTLTRLYIVAEFRKHCYKIKPFSSHPLSSTFQQKTPISPMIGSSMSSWASSAATTTPPPASSSSLSALSLSISPSSATPPTPSIFTSKKITLSHANSNINNTNLLNQHNPSNKSNASTASTASNPNNNTIISRHIHPDIPKVNVAPMTNTMNGQEMQLPALMPHRFAPIAARMTGSPRGAPNVTHPTQQYFLQTSSSTLNAAASAAVQRTRRTLSIPSSEATMAGTDKASGNTDASGKVGMSIRSLLC
ncbi:Zn(2)-C6 fungal-specific transcription factor [Phycomyces blakesleeanus]|uniref:Zn(2)-C6 fungal-specific transcription factor n=1 Tax=Phycomyces blakesleeanus TaxID=4837 RepID=A0ABR3B9W0_PHYBL